MTNDRPDLTKTTVVRPASFAQADPADPTTATSAQKAAAPRQRAEPAGAAQWARTRTFRFKAEEDATLVAAAAATGDTMTDLLRHAILATYAEYRPN